MHREAQLATIADMETWEYFTTTFQADTERFPTPLIDGVPLGGQPQHSVYSLIPQLAAAGFETETFFVTFKRRTSS